MKRRSLFLVAAGVLAAVALAAAVAYRPLTARLEARVFKSAAGFEEWPLPLKETHRLFDIGAVDANGDGWLDIYTSNHHFRQSLLLADGKGAYRDVLSDWGLDQSVFPLAELSFVAPTPDKAGVYVYWHGTDFVIRTHRLSELGEMKGSLRVFEPVAVMKSEGIVAEKREARAGEGAVTESRVDFTAAADGILVLRPGGQGVPLDFNFSGAIRPSDIFVGLGKVQPKALSFSLAMQDRHGMAWADFNGDGVLDLFINRGALSGRLRAFPQQVSAGVRDELFVSRGPGVFEERGQAVGLRKNGCSGRHAQWLDFDGDGLIDLFVNCYDRGNVSGAYPKQLYRQSPPGVLKDVAEQVGLDLPERQMGNLAWLDVDGDGAVDLLAVEDDGLFLYRRGDGSFRRQAVAQRPVDNAPSIGRATEAVWFFDGKFSVADYDRDGRADVFFSSRRGNLLLRNAKGALDVIDLPSVGLPAKSVTASWIDYDNDGRPDLFFVPQGIYRQRPDGRFEATGLLAVDADRYEAAIVNWLDFDNDGRVDLLLALSESPDFRHWWEIEKKPKPRGRWRVIALRNVAAKGRWLQVELAGQEANRQGIGAKVTLELGGATPSQVVGGSEGAFFSQGHYRIYFGLGAHNEVGSLRVRWSDGYEQVLTKVAADRLLRIQRSSGAAVPSAAVTGVAQ